MAMPMANLREDTQKSWSDELADEDGWALTANRGKVRGGHVSTAAAWFAGNRSLIVFCVRRRLIYNRLTWALI